MIKYITRFINATLLMATFVLAFALARPMLRSAFAQQSSNCPNVIERETRCSGNSTDFYGPSFFACISTPTACCQYTMLTHKCLFPDGTKVTAGANGYYNGYSPNSFCGSDGACRIKRAIPRPFPENPDVIPVDHAPDPEL